MRGRTAACSPKSNGNATRLRRIASQSHAFAPLSTAAASPSENRLRRAENGFLKTELSSSVPRTIRFVVAALRRRGPAYAEGKKLSLPKHVSTVRRNSSSSCISEVYA